LLIAFFISREACSQPIYSCGYLSEAVERSEDVERFIVDEMLMRLGRWLRMLGQDVANPDNADDRELIERALAEKRTLLTRDKNLVKSCMKASASCVLIKSPQLEEQLKEISRMGIALEIKPQRCTICNSPLRRIESPLREEWQCEGCGKRYWVGSHWEKMEKMLDRVHPRN
jgi:uncharacterized protein with PIN domain